MHLFVELSYVLACENKQKVLIVKCPADNKEQKQFLGYEWSSAKGNEGIKYINQSVVAPEIEDAETKELVQKISGLHNINTPLYNPNNRNDSNKINQYIQENFHGKELPVIESLSSVVSYHNLTDLLDFSRVNFNKPITLSPKKISVIQSKWDLVKLETLAKDLYAGGDAPKTNYSETKTSKFQIPIYANGFENKGLYGYTDTPIVKEPCVTISARGTLGYTEIRTEPFVPIVRLIVLIPNDLIELQYLKLALTKVDFVDSGAVIPQLTIPKVKSIKIPLPPKAVQQELIKEINVIENEVEKAEKTIIKANEDIEGYYAELFQKSNQKFKFSNDELFEVSIGRRVLAKDVTEDANSGIPVYSANVLKPFGYINKKLLDNFDAGSILWGIDGDWMVNTIEPNNPFYPTDHCGVIRVKSKELNYKYVAWVLRKAGIDERFNRANRAATERIKGIIIQAPPIKDQLKSIEKIEKLEAIIKREQDIITASPDKKNEVMKKYL